MPFPDPDRPVDILDANLAAILEANVDPIADAFVDDRGDANPTRLGERFQTRGNIDAIAINVAAFNNNITKVDADSQHNCWLRSTSVRPLGTVALHRKCTIHSVDHATKLGDDAIPDQFHNAATMGGDSRVEDCFPVAFQSGKRARLVGSHQAGVAHYVGREDCR